MRNKRGKVIIDLARQIRVFEAKKRDAEKKKKTKPIDENHYITSSYNYKPW